MKKIAFVFAFLLTISFQVNAQWFWQNPLPQGNHLYSVCFTDINTGTAVGSSGTILRTTNGGATWSIKTIGSTTGLYPLYRFWSVCFTDSNTGTIVGDPVEENGWHATILHTTDGGEHWTPQTSGVPYSLLDVYFTDANTGTAVGDNGAILRTTNGGDL